jgi:glycosyltransferase involved in cell wall biosynthesis
MTTRTPNVPRVSVVIPAHRASGDIAAALDSVSAQTFSDFEVIVVNDGSPDTPDLEGALAPFRSHIRYIAQENRGAGAARNAAIREARGSYVALLDADDRWAPDFLRCQVSYLDAHEECDLVYCDALITGESPLAGRRFMATAPSVEPVTLLSLIGQRCNIILSTVVVRRETLMTVGLFDETLRREQDFDLWLRLALRGAAIQYHRHVLADRRVHADGLSGDAVAELQRAIAVLDHFGRQHDLDGTSRTALRIQLMVLVDRLEIERGKQRLLEGNFAAARSHLRAVRRQPVKLRIARVAAPPEHGLKRLGHLTERRVCTHRTTADVDLPHNPG